MVLIPSTTISVKGILKSYFNLFNNKLERKIRAKRLLLRLRRLSLHKIYISNSEFKHTNNKVLINIYLYNRQKYNYIHKLNNIYIEKMLKKKTRKNIIDKLKSIQVKGLKEESLKKSLNVLNNRDYRINSSGFISEYITNFYNKVLKISIRRIRMYFLYKQLMFINKSKLNYTYLQILKKLLEKLYNKNVEFNLINLKRSYLNSDTLFEVVKLKLTRNRRKMLKTINKIKNKIKLHKKLITVNSMDTYLYKKDLRYNKLNIFVINNLKYKHVTGFRLEAKGRLTRRYTASRSISKVRYNGNLLNIDSSYKGLSSIMLKGNLKSNVQYTKLISKTRIGSFGLKG